MKFKAFCAVILSVLVVLTALFSVFACRSQNVGGGYTGTSDISAASKEWIIKTFNDCEDTEALLIKMSDFATRNFTYELQRYFPFQVADFDSFISKKGFYGMCFEFAVFAKTVALVWAEEKGVSMQAHICNTYYYEDNEKQAHSYNFFTESGTTYYLDLTGDLNDMKNGKKVTGPLICKASKELVNKALYSPYREEFI